jgi:hypothetical protein
VVRAVGEVVPGVVDDVVGAQGSHQVELRGAGHAGDVGPECLGELHGVAADTTGRADDQHRLSRLDAADVAQRLQGGARGDRHHRCLFEGNVHGLAGELVLSDRGILREGSSGDPEHLVTCGEPGHRRPDRAMTVPATSRPDTGFFGPRNPRTRR